MRKKFYAGRIFRIKLHHQKNRGYLWESILKLIQKDGKWCWLSTLKWYFPEILYSTLGYRKPEGFILNFMMLMKMKIRYWPIVNIIGRPNIPWHHVGSSKKSKLNIINPLDITTSLQEIRGVQPHIQWHERDETAESRM